MKTVLFQAIQLGISLQLSSIWPIDRTVLGATTQRESGPGSDGNEGVLCFPQSYSITGTSLSDCLVSYLGHTLWRGGSYPPLQRSSRSILQSQLTGQIRLKVNVIAQLFYSNVIVLHVNPPMTQSLLSILIHFFSLLSHFSCPTYEQNIKANSDLKLL